jgi:hypothetical protein
MNGVILIALVGIALWSVVATLLAVSRDGYRQQLDRWQATTSHSWF